MLLIHRCFVGCLLMCLYVASCRGGEFFLIRPKATQRTNNEYLEITVTNKARYVLDCDSGDGGADNNVITYINKGNTPEDIQAWRCKLSRFDDLWEKDTIKKCADNTCPKDRKKGCFKNNKLLCICAPQGRDIASAGQSTLVIEGGPTAEAGCIFTIPPAPPVPHKAEGVSYNVKYYYPSYTVMRSSGTRAWRNNNPGNMRGGVTNYTPIGKAGGFAVFATDRIGRAALFALLKTPGYQKLTLEQVIHKYAPPIENDTSLYVTLAEKGTGKPASTPLTSFNAKDLEALVNTISIHEGWKEGKEERM